MQYGLERYGKLREIITTSTDLHFHVSLKEQCPNQKFYLEFLFELEDLLTSIAKEKLPLVDWMFSPQLCGDSSLKTLRIELILQFDSRVDAFNAIELNETRIKTAFIMQGIEIESITPIETVAEFERLSEKCIDGNYLFEYIGKSVNNLLKEDHD